MCWYFCSVCVDNIDSRCWQFILLCTLLLCTWSHWVMNTFISTPPSPHSGITHIGGICNPVRSCAVVKDTGLSTVFTVAHELGHSLGLHHDGDQPNGCASGYHIMAPSFSSSSNPHFWSHCSKKHLQEFLRYGDWAGKKFQLLNCFVWIVLDLREAVAWMMSPTQRWLHRQHTHHYQEWSTL